jgi:hypothetical protein
MAAAFFNISFTFLHREAGIAATPGTQSGLARPAVLWKPGIAGELQCSENLVKAVVGQPLLAVRATALGIQMHGTLGEKI